MIGLGLMMEKTIPSKWFHLVAIDGFHVTCGTSAVKAWTFISNLPSIDSKPTSTSYSHFPFKISIFIPSSVPLRFHSAAIVYICFFNYHNLKAYSKSTFCFHFSEWLVWLVKQQFHLPLLYAFVACIVVVWDLSLLFACSLSVMDCASFSSQLIQCLF